MSDILSQLWNDEANATGDGRVETIRMVQSPAAIADVAKRATDRGTPQSAAQHVTVAEVRQPIPVVCDVRPLAEPAAKVNRGKLHAEMVAGAVAEGHGILTGFTGRGVMTRATLLATLAEAGMPAEWAPAAKSAHAHAGRVLNALNQSGYVCRADTKRRKERTAVGTADAATAMAVAMDAKAEGRHYDADAIVRYQTNGIPTWAARWEVAIGRGRAAEVGAAFGTVVMIATLDQRGELLLECDDEALTRRVREDFEARRSSEEFQAADVSAWIKSTLVNRFRAAQLGGNWYVRKQYAGEAERFLAAFARRWGENWILPALPIATTDQLRVGIANGLIGEANALLAEYRELLTAKQDKSGTALASSKTATALHAKVVALGERAVGFGYVLGNAYVMRVRETLAKIAGEIAESIRGPVTSFEYSFDVAARDEAAKGS